MYVCGACAMLVRDYECGAEKLKQNQSTVFDDCIIKLVTCFDL